MRGRGSTLLGFVVTGVIAVPSAAFVLQQSLTNAPQERMELTSSSGALSITNSHDGEAILNAAPMLPGTQTTGTVDLKNTGSGSETMTLDAGDPVDQPGPGGGLLSHRLQLRVEDVSDASSPQVVYDGDLTGLHLASLGTWASGEQHTYRFVVTFPDGGSDGADNAYQGSSTSIGFDWTAGDGGPTAPPAGAPYVQQVAGDEPLGSWPLDGSTADMTDATGGHDGTYANSITTADGTAPGGGHPAWFDGTTAYGYVNGVTAPTSAYTLEAWVRPADGSDMVILEQGDGGALAIRSGHYAFREVDTTLHSSTDVTVGHWQHVVGTWDAGTDTARLYVDGQLADAAPAATAPTGHSTLYVGRGAWPAGSDGTTSTAAGDTGDLSFFHGAMAQVSYYPTALSADRIAAHYNAGAADATDGAATAGGAPTAGVPSDDSGASASPSGAQTPPADAGAADPGTSGASPAPTTTPKSSCAATVTAQSKKAAAKKKPAPKKKTAAKKKPATKLTPKQRALAKWHAARALAQAKAKAKAQAKARAACAARAKAAAARIGSR